jgi:hypothetical protein
MRDHRHGFLARGRLANNAHIRMALENRADALAQDRMVVDEDDADHGLP